MLDFFQAPTQYLVFAIPSVSCIFCPTIFPVLFFPLVEFDIKHFGEFIDCLADSFLEFFCLDPFCDLAEDF